MRKKLLSLLCATTVLAGCDNKNTAEKPDEYSISRYPITDALRERDGWRVFYNDNNGEVKEIKYIDGITGVNPAKILERDRFKGLEKGGPSVRVYRDLPADKEGFVRSIRTSAQFADYAYDEIHLKTNYSIKAGIIVRSE